MKLSTCTIFSLMMTLLSQSLLVHADCSVFLLSDFEKIFRNLPEKQTRIDTKLTDQISTYLFKDFDVELKKISKNIPWKGPSIPISFKAVAGEYEVQLSRTNIDRIEKENVFDRDRRVILIGILSTFGYEQGRRIFITSKEFLDSYEKLKQLKKVVIEKGEPSAAFKAFHESYLALQSVPHKIFKNEVQAVGLVKGKKYDWPEKNQPFLISSLDPVLKPVIDSMFVLESKNTLTSFNVFQSRTHAVIANTTLIGIRSAIYDDVVGIMNADNELIIKTLQVLIADSQQSFAVKMLLKQISDRFEIAMHGSVK